MWDIRRRWNVARVTVCVCMVYGPFPRMTRSAHRYPKQLHPDSPRGHVARSPIRTPSGRSTRHSRSSHPDDGISYPDMSGSLTKVHKPCYIIPIACHNPRFVALRWCVRMPILLAFWICLWQRTSKLLFFMF